MNLIYERKHWSIAAWLTLLLTPVALAAAPAQSQPDASTSAPSSSAAAQPSSETQCADGKDNDGDSMTDCADQDCLKTDVCKADGNPENTNKRCSDWIDNDGNGAVDCDDSACGGPGITVCKGSWKGSLNTGGGSGNSGAPEEEIPDLGAGMSVEDLIGKGSDKDGERNDQLCSDGIDNDKDGRIDCADFGCRFDPTVTVCRGNPGMRFSVVAGIEQSYNIKSYRDGDGTMDTRFSRIQLRSFGPVPLIQNSFYLLSMRAEKTPRLTFAMFQMPVGKSGHYININSGGGGLSPSLILSAAKQLLLEPAYYVYNAFEQGNGASAEFGGPIGDSGKLQFRVFVAGGSGRFSGNVGGRYFSYNNTNYTYAAGAQVAWNILGHYSRFDNPFLYTPVPTTLAFTFGAKYDQRAQERYAATNSSLVLRTNRLVLMAENYSKQELEFESFQTAYVVQLGFLVIPKRLLIAADFGEYLIPSPMKNPPSLLQTDLKKQLEERQWRLAAHMYFYRNIGIVSLLYKNRSVANPKPGLPANLEQQLSLEAQYRF
ncbi:MAG TPA: hypothetical protein DCQ06_06875 [Myxococcales bacterium]|nr:hypothetical protein [Myxococcales bacterium]HAN31307.1 hypothetical protein [Myxococcales bacterium]